MATLINMRTAARSKADMPGSNFVTDSELNHWINEGVQLVHDKLVAAYSGDYMETSSSFTCDGTAGIDLPTDFYKLLGVDLNWQGRTRTLTPYQLHERNLVNQPEGYTAPPRYKLSGGFRLFIYPIQSNGTAGTLWYIPKAPILTADADYADFPNAWEKYVETYAAMQMMMKEESDPTLLLRQVEKWDKELEEMAENRNAGIPRSVVDVCERDYWWDW